MNFKQAIGYTNKIYKFLRKINSEGTSLPGKYLRKFYPEFLRESQNYVTSYKYAITGTNGKTTTAGILAQILKETQKTVIHNELGANMPNGIATALALGLFNNFKANGDEASVDNFVIESDEAYLSEIFENIIFDYLLVTNLFRDQLDRYGELDITKRKIQEGIRLNPDLKLIINADDPCLYDIDKNIRNDMITGKKRRKTIFYGFENVEFCDYDTKSNSPSEVIYCPVCKKPLKYTKRFYSQLGLWDCSCRTKRPKTDITASVKVFRGYSILNVNYENKSIMYKVNLSGLYNAYNALGAIAGAYMAGIDRKVIARALENYKPVFGREQNVKIEGREVILYLIKNPTGASEVLRSLKNIKNTKLMISINDKYADGRDVSWLWDADFDILEKFREKIYITGTRADDMALRLKYVGVDPGLMVIDNNIKKTFEFALKSMEKGEKLIVLPTYTSLLKLNKIIKNKPNCK